MSRLFGPMRQVGYVVRDIEKAMNHWAPCARLARGSISSTAPIKRSFITVGITTISRYQWRSPIPETSSLS